VKYLGRQRSGVNKAKEEATDVSEERGRVARGHRVREGETGGEGDAHVAQKRIESTLHLEGRRGREKGVRGE
jgi:hypothetical protein